MGEIRIGVSGWSYDEWRGDFYPEGLARRRWLHYASRVFPTIEINGTFYGLQRPESFAKWSAATPPGFVFALKGSRFITHSKKLDDVAGPLANFFAQGVLRLGRKLGPILWQLPATLEFDDARVARFLSRLPRDTDAALDLARQHDRRVRSTWLEPQPNHRLRHVIEPRHASFFTPPFARLARRHGVAIAFADSPGWPWTEELTAGFAYLRMHGRHRLYHGRYSGAALDDLAARLQRWQCGAEPDRPARITRRAPPPRKSRDVYVYFDNDAGAHAPRDAIRLMRRLGLGPRP